jgi:tRNA pseudouridine55 synthase
MSQRKSYHATIKLGATTATLDPESQEIVTEAPLPVGIEQLRQVLSRFVGTIQQRPPAFSALKVGGKRAYELARRGRQPDMPARPVVIYSLKILRFDWPMLEVSVDCGRGTYIRSLARDIGQALQVGGYLTGLRRTRIGDYSVHDAISIDRLTAADLWAHLRPAAPTASRQLSDS